jgi:glycosyltransferase involved in cell wall biosynthesis
MTRVRTVLAVIHTPTYGGPHNQIATIAPRLEEHGWRYVVATTDQPGDGAERLRSRGIDVCCLSLHRPRRPFASVNNLSWIISLRREIRAIHQLALAESTDVIQVCGLMYPQGAIAAREAGKPLVWQLLGLFPPPPLRRVFTPVVRRLADVVMVAGKATAAAHPGLPGCPAVRVFYPPVDLNRFYPESARRREVRGRLGFGEQDVVVGAVSNAVAGKRLELIPAAATVAHRTLGSSLRVGILLAGRIPPGAENYWHRTVMPAISEARQHGLKAVTITDPEPAHVADLYRSLDVFCMTSSTEGVPTTLLEALATGIPAVAVAVGGTPEVLSSEAGILLPRTADAKAVGIAVGRLCRDSLARKRMGGAARTLAGGFSLESCVRAHLSAFEHALAARAAHPRRRGIGE